jgi:MFS family permease
VLVLHVRELGGSYTFAGVVAGAYTAGLAASAPVVGRAVDRLGQTLVLGVGMVVTAAAMLALALLPSSTPDWVLPLLAVGGGLVHPPIGACTRALLPQVIDEDDTLHSAYALESSALELSYISGPLVIGGLIASQSTRAGLVACAVVLVVGTTWFITLPASRAWSPDPGETRRSALGALASRGVRVLLLTLTAFAVSFGAIEVAVTAAATELDAEGATGPLLAAWGLGSMLGGLAVAAAPAPVDPARRLLLTLAVLAGCNLLLVLAAGSWALAGLLPLAGLAVAPVFAVSHAMAGVAARDGTSVEAFAWLGTGVSAGAAMGAALAGGAADGGGSDWAFGVAFVAIAAALVLFLLAWPRDADGTAPADAGTVT